MYGSKVKNKTKECVSYVCELLVALRDKTFFFFGGVGILSVSMHATS